MFSRTRYTKEQFIEAVKNNISIAGILKEIGLKVTGANYDLCKIKIQKLGLDTSHHRGKGYLKGTKNNWTPKQPIETICVENSTYTSSVCLKERLLREGYLQYQCAICGINEWQGLPLVLQLDHINGNKRDNRLINIRLVCPNCHSQTHTFAGKNKAKGQSPTPSSPVQS